MPDMQWLAAVLAPTDVAVHPNFADEERLTSATLLASAVTRGSTLARSRPLTPEQGSTLLGGLYGQLVNAAEQSLTVGSVLDGARTLDALSQAVQLDLAAAVAAALL